MPTVALVNECVISTWYLLKDLGWFSRNIGPFVFAIHPLGAGSLLVDDLKWREPPIYVGPDISVWGGSQGCLCLFVYLTKTVQGPLQEVKFSFKFNGGVKMQKISTIEQEENLKFENPL